MAKKKSLFPTFRKWFKKLTRKQKIGLFIGAFALFMLPLAIYAAQREVEVNVGAAGMCTNCNGPNQKCFRKNNVKKPGKFIWTCKTVCGSYNNLCGPSEKCVKVISKSTGKAKYECRSKNVKVAPPTATPSASPDATDTTEE